MLTEKHALCNVNRTPKLQRYTTPGVFWSSSFNVQEVHVDKLNE